MRWSLSRHHATTTVAEEQLESAPPGDSLMQPAGCTAEVECVLYHQTSPESAMAIMASGCMQPGPKGNGGSGIYFAADPLATTCKANRHGVILECRVRLGRVRHVGRKGDWDSRLRRWLLRYDSVALTFLEGGIEYVVYDATRVASIKVHKVLHTSCSSSGISVESSSSSFRIGTATDPGRSSSSSSSQSDESGSSGNSISGDSNTGHSSSLCYQELCSSLDECVLSGSSCSCSDMDDSSLLPPLQQHASNLSHVNPQEVRPPHIQGLRTSAQRQVHNQDHQQQLAGGCACPTSAQQQSDPQHGGQQAKPCMCTARLVPLLPDGDQIEAM